MYLIEEQHKYYSYILGLYLGDGYISKFPRTYKLLIALHVDEIDVHSRAIQSLKKLFPKNKVSTYHRKSKTSESVVDIGVYSSLLHESFPQHGKGKKNSRKIELVDWQEQIIENYPEFFVVGLYDADGTSYMHKVGKYIYLRYNFINTSTDIINLFHKYLKMDVNITIKSKDVNNPLNINLTNSKPVYRIQLQDQVKCQQFQNVINSVYSFFESPLDNRLIKFST
jgi:hypothetical protein